ncbi:hypothetical protein KL921_001611 [Ogataea angusta]|nr:hypothetical protein KL921_001611 [Ogataea angusta]KAG7847967.1 hypothetical protein KL941_002146 [Ogataea angusta]
MLAQPARDLRHGARDGHDANHAHQIRPGEPRVAGVGERVPQGGCDRGQKAEHRERDSERGDERELSFELLFVAEGQDDRLVLVDGVVHEDLLRPVGQHRGDVHLVHRDNRGGGPDSVNVRGHGANWSRGPIGVYIYTAYQKEFNCAYRQRAVLKRLIGGHALAATEQTLQKRYVEIGPQSTSEARKRFLLALQPRSGVQ